MINKEDYTLLIAVEAMLNNNMKLFRNEQIMLSEDVAKLYEVTPEHLQKQVKKNIKRFPEDFMLRLTKKEQELLKTECCYAFTEKGILMAGGVLNSKKAIKVHIQLVRYFVKLYKENSEKIVIKNMEINALFEVLKQMIKGE